jgi:hypothetical protein
VAVGPSTIKPDGAVVSAGGVNCGTDDFFDVVVVVVGIDVVVAAGEEADLTFDVALLFVAEVEEAGEGVPAFVMIGCSPENRQM